MHVRPYDTRADHLLQNRVSGQTSIHVPVGMVLKDLPFGGVGTVQIQLVARPLARPSV